MAEPNRPKADIIPYSGEFAQIVSEWIDTARTARNLGLNDLPEPEDLVAERWQKMGGHGFMLISHGDPVAYAELCDRPRLLAVEIMHLLVDPEKRNQGFGSQMLELLFERAVQRPEVAKVILNLEGDNKAALGCYFRAGFELSARNLYVSGLTLIRRPNPQVRMN